MIPEETAVARPMRRLGHSLLALSRRNLWELAVFALVSVGLCFAVPLFSSASLGEASNSVLLVVSSSRKVLHIVASAIPLWLTAFAFSLPLQARFFNIGAEGQVVAGSLGAALVLTWAGQLTSGALFVVPALLVAVGVGAAIGGFAAFVPLHLKRRFELSEVISTLLMNSCLLLLAGWILRAPGIGDFSGSSQGLKSVRIADEIREPLLMVDHGGAVLSWFFLLACTLLMATDHVLWRTLEGLRIRATGWNRRVAEFCGLLTDDAVLRSVLVGGALAGVAGIDRVIAAGRFDSTHYSGLAFEGIAVGLMGRHRADGIVIAGVFVSFWKQLGNRMQMDLEVAPELFLAGQGVALIIFLTWGNLRGRPPVRAAGS